MTEKRPEPEKKPFEITARLELAPNLTQDEKEEVYAAINMAWRLKGHEFKVQKPDVDTFLFQFAAPAQEELILTYFALGEKSQNYVIKQARESETFPKKIEVFLKEESGNERLLFTLEVLSDPIDPNVPPTRPVTYIEE